MTGGLLRFSEKEVGLTDRLALDQGRQDGDRFVVLSGAGVEPRQRQIERRILVEPAATRPFEIADGFFDGGRAASPSVFERCRGNAAEHAVGLAVQGVDRERGSRFDGRIVQAGLTGVQRRELGANLCGRWVQTLGRAVRANRAVDLALALVVPPQQELVIGGCYVGLVGRRR